MMMKLFDVENDGITVNKERVEKWSYVKYPPHSKFLLVKNLQFVALLLVLVLFAILSMFSFDVIDWTHYLVSFALLLVPIGALCTTINEWKKGKYFTDKN